MRLVIQRVSQATLTAEDGFRSEIGEGLFILIGVTGKDTKETANKSAEKVFKMRLMADEEDKMNLTVKDVNGEFLVVSQFTLYGDTSDGNRPSFVNASRPEHAQPIYEAFIKKLHDLGAKVSTGSFGNHMDINPTLDGPVTILLET